MSDEGVESRYQQGIKLLNQHRYSQAEARFRGVLELAPDHLGATHYLGYALLRLDQFERALEWAEKAVAMEPRVPDCHHTLAAVYRGLGRIDEAVKAYQNALRLRPDYPSAWFNYAAVKRWDEDETALPTIEKLLARPNRDSQGQDFLHFAAAKVCDDQGHYDKAFEHFRIGNELRGEQFDRQAYLERVLQVESTYSKAAINALAENKVGNESREPIFIVGMPRSGTTLVEQILASHPKIEGAGELDDITDISRSLAKHTGGGEYIGDLSKIAFKDFDTKASFYLGRRQSLRKEQTLHIIDKMPGNFAHVGLIRCLFPHARFIHCLRDPRDTCLSCWTQRFRTGQEFSGDLGDLGFYYRTHERLMRHWKDIAPEMIYSLQYEDLIDEPETVVRGLLKFCQVEWDDACLRFHENKRAVGTASSFQVRRPLNRRGIDRWKNYEAHLGPLFKALEEYAPLAEPGEMPP